MGIFRSAAEDHASEFDRYTSGGDGGIQLSVFLLSSKPGYLTGHGFSFRSWFGITSPWVGGFGQKVLRGLYLSRMMGFRGRAYAKYQ